MSIQNNNSLSSNPDIAYCWRWNFQENSPASMLSEAEARAKYIASEDFTAILASNDKAHTRVLVTPIRKTGHVLVDFIDTHGRKDTAYVFVTYENKLFLRKVIIWQYPNSTPGLRLAESIRIENIFYKIDGTVKRTVIDKKAGTKEAVTYTAVPVQSHWEPVPMFGEYQSIGRYERS